MGRRKGSRNLHKRYDIPTMIKAIHEYTDKHEIPILKDCCFENEWNYDYFIELQRNNPELAQEARRLLMKKEIKLEQFMYTGQNNVAFIFALKQLGWKDNPEPLVVNNSIQNNVGGNRSDKLKKCSAETLEELESLYDEIEKENGETEKSKKDSSE